MRFVHRDEPFWPVLLTPRPTGLARSVAAVPIASPGDDQTVCPGATVTLRGTALNPTRPAKSDKNDKNDDDDIDIDIDNNDNDDEFDNHNGNGDNEVHYAWRQTVGPTVVLSDRTAAEVHFRAPDTDCVLEFELTVRRGANAPASFPSAVAVYVVGRRTPVGANVAPRARTVSASSETHTFGAEARAAVDGVADGVIRMMDAAPYGGPTHEWVAEAGDTIGAWLELAWAPPVAAIARIGLAERPLWDAHITAGKLEFSDGSLVDVGELDRVGMETTIDFRVPKRNISWVRFTVTDVLRTGEAIGLSEFAVYEHTTPAPCPTPSPPPPSLPPKETPATATETETETKQVPTADPAPEGHAHHGATDAAPEEDDHNSLVGLLLFVVVVGAIVVGVLKLRGRGRGRGRTELPLFMTDNAHRE